MIGVSEGKELTRQIFVDQTFVAVAAHQKVQWNANLKNMTKQAHKKRAREQRTAVLLDKCPWRAHPAGRASWAILIGIGLVDGGLKRASPAAPEVALAHQQRHLPRAKRIACKIRSDVIDEIVNKVNRRGGVA